jgi:hypothetical protein
MGQHPSRQQREVVPPLRPSMWKACMQQMCLRSWTLLVWLCAPGITAHSLCIGKVLTVSSCLPCL